MRIKLFSVALLLGYLTTGDYAKSAEYYDRAVALGMEGSKNGAEKARAALAKEAEDKQ